MMQIPLLPFYTFALIFLRTLSLLTFFPILGEKFVPLKIRILMCGAIAIALVGIVPVNPFSFPQTAPGLVRLACTEGLLGLGLAFVGKVLFGIVQYSGQIVGQEIGFGMVNSVDPSAHQVTVIAEVHYLLAVLLFFAADLHQVVFASLARSFEILPPGTAMLTTDLSHFMLGLGSTLFSLSVGFAMPVIAMNFAINVAMGMVGRAVPQMNVFVESFPIRIVAGMSMIMLSIGFTASMWERMFGDMGGMMDSALKAMK